MEQGMGRQTIWFGTRLEEWSKVGGHTEVCGYWGLTNPYGIV